MTETSQEDILIAVHPSQARRWMGVFAFALLGILLISIVFVGRPPILYQLAFVAGGLAALWAANRMRIATDQTLELTRHELRTGDGQVLTTVENVRAVERGAFAFKPSNGFLVRLKQPSGRGWAPGLWWQRGTYLGIGGAVPGGQSRAMAEVLTALSMGIFPDDDA